LTRETYLPTHLPTLCSTLKFDMCNCIPFSSTEGYPLRLKSKHLFQESPIRSRNAVFCVAVV
jgi:hypothetical protein